MEGFCGYRERGGVSCMDYVFADAGRGELSCLLVTLEGCLEAKT